MTTSVGWGFTSGGSGGGELPNGRITTGMLFPPLFPVKTRGFDWPLRLTHPSESAVLGRRSKKAVPRLGLGPSWAVSRNGDTSFTDEEEHSLSLNVAPRWNCWNQFPKFEFEFSFSLNDWWPTYLVGIAGGWCWAAERARQWRVKVPWIRSTVEVAFRITR